MAVDQWVDQNIALCYIIKVLLQKVLLSFVKCFNILAISKLVAIHLKNVTQIIIHP